MSEVVFIHGFLGRSSDWTAIQKQLSVKSRAIEIPVCGSWSETVKCIADDLPQSTHLVGYSMGGRLAIGCAEYLQSEGSNAIRRLAVISASSGLPKNERSRRLEHDRAIAARIRNIRDTDKRKFLQEWYKQAVFTGLGVDDIDRLVTLRSQFDGERMATMLESLSVARQPDYGQFLAEIRCPMVFAAGERDTKYVAQGRELQKLSSQITFHKIEACGHAVPFEKPQEVVKILSDFFDIPPCSE